MKKIFFMPIFLIIIVIAIIIIFFIKKDYKFINLGNNIITKSSPNDVLNLNSYEAEVTVTIYSNKNTNTYKILQKYVKPNLIRQEVLEPDNIKGLIITYDGKDLKVENTKLNLSKIYRDYEYITRKCVDAKYIFRRVFE